MAWVLDHAPESAAAARGIVRMRLRDFDAVFVRHVELLASELVANAMLHGEGLIELDVEIEVGRVGVAVSDCGPSPLVPSTLDPSGRQESGRGLFLVESLASRWGVVDAGDAKMVWFELDGARASI